MTAKRNRILRALVKAIVDRVTQRRVLRPVPESVRIDGKVCLVTGANSGLGKAVAIDLAKRGGHVLMACRGGHPDAGEDVRRSSGSDAVEMLKVDLADLDSVHALCDELKRGRGHVDIAVLNAGMMPLNARRSPQGYELMFAVHFLANRLLVDRLLADGTIRPSSRPGEAPRIVFVVSEMHRTAGPIDFSDFGGFTDYGLKDGLKYYALSKLHLCTYAQELSRRLNPGREVRASVTSLCPGADPLQTSCGSAGVSEAPDLPGHAPALRDAGEGRGAGHPCVLRRRHGPAQRSVPAPDAGEKASRLARDEAAGAGVAV